MFIIIYKKTHVETSNKNGLDFFHFHQLLKYEKNMLNAYYLIYIYIYTYIKVFIKTLTWLTLDC